LKRFLICMVVVFLAGCLLFLFSGCRGSSTTGAEDQTVVVRRGNISIDITGAGNLALSKTQDLAFEIAGYVQEVLVKEGDSVQEGQVLAQIDTSEWEKQLKTLQKALDTANRSLTNAQSNVTKAERNLAASQTAVTKAESQVVTKEFAQRQAQIDLENAQHNLDEIEVVKTAQAAVDSQKNCLELAQAALKLARRQDEPVDSLMDDIQFYQEGLEKAEAKLQAVLRGTGVNISSTVALQIAQSQLKVEQAQKSLKDAGTAVEDARAAVKDAGLDVQDAGTAIDNAVLDRTVAEQNILDAQANLDEAKNLSPLVKAPFAGFISSVKVSGGDEVQKGTIAMQLADPRKFTADIIVGESDIIKVEEGGLADVQVDAIPGLTLVAKVSHISPTATVQSGVVSYKVTVEMENLQTAGNAGSSRTIPDSVPQPGSNSSPGIPAPSPEISGPSPSQNNTDTFSSPETSGIPRFPRASRAPGDGSFASRFAGNAQFPTAVQGPVSGSSGVSQIKAGMSVTVSIVVTRKSGILLVPNQAISYSAGKSQVRVAKDGKVETRIIETGINNWQYTEVVQGLDEGEDVLFSLSTGSVSNSGLSQPNRQGPSSFNVPGGVRIR